MIHMEVQGSWSGAMSLRPRASCLGVAFGMLGSGFGAP